MASGTVHELFEDMYQYSDMYSQEGALSQTTNPPLSSSSPSTASPYPNLHTSAPYAAGQYGGSRPYGAVADSYSPGGIGAGLHPAPAPPSYADVRLQRDQVAYPCQPSARGHPILSNSHQTATSNSAAYPYQYPRSGSSSTSELSDVSSGFGAPDAARPTGSAMTSPLAGGGATTAATPSGGGGKPYASSSSVDSSSGFGSYSCETPEQAESAYKPQPAQQQQQQQQQQRQQLDETYPAPPPPLHEPTRLEQQLSNMSVGSDYGRQNSYQSPMSPSPSHPPGAPPTPPGAPPGPYYGAPKTPQSPGAAPPTAHRPQPTIPDAVLNMAAKGEPDKKPWTYAPDMDSIREQRDKVRRRTPHGGMPRYQQVLNLPKFDDPPRPRAGAQQTPPHTPGGPQTSATPDYAPGPGRATVAHLQYNSPLYLYSEDKVAEAFSGQTEGIVTGVAGLKKDQGKDITQSPVYRMVHGLDDDKPKTRRHVADEASPYKAPRAPAEDDELKFSGVIDKSEIPSKSFHRLQNMTAGSEIDTTSIRQNISGEVPDDEIGAYDQASIRYTGKNIPSRSFKMLQSLTGDDSSATDLPVSQPRRQRRQRPPPEAEEPEQNPDDIVDISYVGSNIPSRSFKVLQHAVGEQDTTQPASQTTPYQGTTIQNGQGRTVKVIKLRQQQPERQTESSGVTDF